MKFFIALLFVSTSALAANSATLKLRGVVPEVCGVSIAETVDATSIDILLGEVGVKVATVTETCNKATGYTISMSSASGSKLVLGTSQFPYTLAYGKTTYKTITTIPLVMKTVSSLTTRTVVTSDILFTMVGQINALSGTYVDTVTISIVGN